MILHTFDVDGIGCFSNPITVGPLSSRINLLSAPNGLGKTTLLRATVLAFVEQHRAKSADILALRPWGRRLTPQVAITFESAGQVYRLRKRFLDGASVHIERREGDVWSSFSERDHAEEFLRELIRTATDNPHCSKPESGGLSQVLWVPQGDLSLSSLASNVVECIHRSLDAQLSARWESR